MENITSKDNQNIKEYVKLSTSKSYRNKLNSFVIEGVKLIVEALENNVLIEMVFVTASCLEKRSQELEKLFQTVKTVLITDELSIKLTQQKSPQGIYAICKTPDNLLTIDKIKADKGKYIMLVDLQDSGNVGTIIRCAEAVGFDGVILSEATCDVLNPKVIRATMGSIFRMNIMQVSDCIDFINNLNSVSVKTYASVVEETACNIISIDNSPPIVMLIGNEGNGLPDDIVSLCSKKVTIKMPGNSESINAAMAACILMWEISKNN